MTPTSAAAASGESGPHRPARAAEVAFYRGVLGTLRKKKLPFLVGGAFALAHFTGIHRDTKDLDLFIRRRDFERIAEVLGQAGYATALTYPHWLGKVRGPVAFIDLIFNSGNGVSPVDDSWFEHALDAQVMGLPARLVAPEESLWTKAFIMERERYDGADVAHLLLACAERLDWPRLLRRFGPHWRVLLMHLVLFGFVYPAERGRVPAWVLDELTGRLRDETLGTPPSERVCAGTLLSREQYLHDLGRHGYTDGRLAPPGTMDAQDVAAWTRAIRGEPAAAPAGRGVPRSRPGRA